jgi:hypothetical protein
VYFLSVDWIGFRCSFEVLQSMLKRLSLLVIAALASTAMSRAAIPLRPQIDVTGYVIHTDLDPATGRLSATAPVTFTTLDDLNVVTFGLNNALQIASIVDGGAAVAAPAAGSGPTLGNKTGRAAAAPASRPVPA